VLEGRHFLRTASKFARKSAPMNPLGMNRTEISESLTKNLSSGGVVRTLRGTPMAPTFVAPKWAMTISGHSGP
jgi:hypothetical protein